MNQEELNRHAQLVELMFVRVLEILKIKNVHLRIMRRQGSKSNENYTLGYIDLRKRIICLDIITPKTLKPKSLNGLIRTLAHEIAHLQKPPYRERYKRRWITRQHYPEFYKQVEKNITKIKKDPILGLHFRN